MHDADAATDIEQRGTRASEMLREQVGQQHDLCLDEEAVVEPREGDRILHDRFVVAAIRVEGARHEAAHSCAGAVRSSAAAPKAIGGSGNPTARPTR